MSDYDLIIRGGKVVTATEVLSADLGIAEGKIAAVREGLGGTARETIAAAGLHIFPGLIDSHVHFNEPGRSDWEGIETGSRALAAGGGTLFFDMPLNAHPPTLNAASFDQKLAAAQASSLVDFAFWGGLVPGNVGHLEELSQRGVIGFKGFMSNSGMEDFPLADEATLREGMKRAAALRKLVAVHAESEAMTSELSRQKLAARATSVRDYLNSRPVAAELEAIRCALELAGETGCALHIVHVSSGAGIRLISAARTAGIDVTCETCPHYLVLTEDDAMVLGAVAKCAPPLRSKPTQEDLWSELRAGEIVTIGSDHSPAPPELKTDANFFNVWGGISGVQHTLPLLITEGHLGRQIALPLLNRLTSLNVADRFGLPAGKGRLSEGADADLAVVDLNKSFKVAAERLLYRHPHSPYIGRTLTGRVVHTILRGQTVFRMGKIMGKAAGRLVRGGDAKALKPAKVWPESHL